METNIIINIFGPSSAGKSTIAELLQGHIERLYTVDFDVVKRQLAGYYWKRDRNVSEQITFDTLISATKAELPILALLPPPKQKEAYERIVAVAEESGYSLINVEITAPKEVLIERYQDRLQKIQESGTTWKFKTLDEFKANLDVVYYRPDNTITFDSSIKSPDNIFQDIKNKIEAL